MNIINIRDLVINCIIGLKDDERINKQDIILNISLYLDNDLFGLQDNLENSVDYELLSNDIVRFVKRSQFYTLEYLANEIAKLCLNKKWVIKVILSVEKPNALSNARTAGVQIERSR